MTTKAFVGKFWLAVSNGSSPETFTRFCEVSDVSGIGVKNDQVDATNTCSDGSKEFIPGLAEGTEPSFTANYTLLDNAIQEELIDSVEAKETKRFQLQFGDGSPTENFTFGMAMLSWEIDPSLTSKNEIKFGGKISGAIVRSHG